MLREFVTTGELNEIRTALSKPHDYTQEELAEGLISAVRRNDKTIVELLLENGADPNYLPLDDWSAVHSAVEHEQAEIVRILVSHGCDINLRDQSGSTPLHVAVDLEGDVAAQLGKRPIALMTALLLKLSADPSICDNGGRSALDVAKSYDHEEAIAMMSDQPT